MIDISNRFLGPAGALAVALGALTIAPMPAAADSHNADIVAAGKKLALDRGTGNCLACHYIDGGTAAGNIGPPLIAMAVRYPDKEKLRAQIWDATITNNQSAMPPFGSHHILSDAEVDTLVEFIWSL